MLRMLREILPLQVQVRDVLYKNSMICHSDVDLISSSASVKAQFAKACSFA